MHVRAGRAEVVLNDGVRSGHLPQTANDPVARADFQEAARCRRAAAGTVDVVVLGRDQSGDHAHDRPRVVGSTICARKGHLIRSRKGGRSMRYSRSLLATAALLAVAL